MPLTQLTGTIIGVSILLIIPVLLYLLLFRDNKTISILFSVIIGSYVLSAYIIIFGLLHLFNGVLILALSLVTTIFIWIVLKKNKLIDVEPVDVDRSMILTVLLFAVFILFLQAMGRGFTSDSIATYLPYGRIIANEHIIPAFHLQNNPAYVISAIPLLYTYIALLFSFFKTNAESLSLGIPLFFAVSTIFLLYMWSKEYKDKNVPLFTMIALLLSFSFFNLCPVVLQESPLLFFATAMFYLLFKYIETRDNLYLILLSASSSLLMLTKHSGILLSILVFSALLFKSRDKKEFRNIIVTFSLFSLIAIIWFSRNFYYYGNPVFPYLAQLFNGELNHYQILLSTNINIYISEAYVSPLQFVRSLFINFPVLIFSFIYMYKNKRSFEAQFVFASYVTVILIMAVNAPRLLERYMYPFFGVLAVFAAVEMSKIYNSRVPKILIKNKEKIAKTVVVIGIISLIVIGAKIENPNKEFLNQNDEFLIYLQQHEGANDVRIFGDRGSEVFGWYGNYTVLKPTCLSLIVLNDGEPFYVNKSSEYYYGVFKRADIKYVYDSSKRRTIDEIFMEIADDEEHFELVLTKNGSRLWRVK